MRNSGMTSAMLRERTTYPPRLKFRIVWTIVEKR
jgi:hypothetical protein